MNSQPCRALAILANADVLEVNGHLVRAWNLYPLDDGSDGPMFTFKHKGFNVDIVKLSFTEKALLEATFKDNCITMVNSEGVSVEVACYNLTPSF